MRVGIGDVRATVWAGIGFLDAHVRGWRKKINLKKLDLRDPTCCVLGEVYGDYSEGVDRLFDGDTSTARNFGFEISDPEDGDYDRLTAEWRTAYRAGQKRGTT